MGCATSQVASENKGKDEDIVSSDDDVVCERASEKVSAGKRRKCHDKTTKKQVEEVEEEEDIEDDEELEQQKRVRKSKRTSSGKSTGSSHSKGSRKSGSRKASGSSKKRSSTKDEESADEVESESEEVIERRSARSERKSRSSSRASSGGKSTHSSKSSAKQRRKVALEREFSSTDEEEDDDIPNQEGGSTIENSVDEEGDIELDDRSHSAHSKDSGFVDDLDDGDDSHIKFISDESSEHQQKFAEQMVRPPTPDLELFGTKIEGKQKEMLDKQKTKKKRAREEKEIMQLCQTNAMDLPPLGISRPKSRGGGLAFDIELPDDAPVMRPKTPSGPKGEIRMPAGLENKLTRQDRSHKKKKPKDISDIQKKLIAAERRKQKQERERQNRIEAMDKFLEVESSQKMQTIKARQTETKLENKINKVENNRDQLIAERKAKLQEHQKKLQEAKRRQAELKARQKAELTGEEYHNPTPKRTLSVL